MSFSFASMIRLMALLAVSATMFAVGLARLVPSESVERTHRPITAYSVNDFLLGVADRHPRWLDSETGTLAVTPLPGDDILEIASCSPWIDRLGRRQVVGRWANREFDGPRTLANDFGLARFSFPDGALLDRVSTESVPVYPPSWFPGDQAQVLFVAGDGQIYRHDFESSDPTSAREHPDSLDHQPTPLAWACPRPGRGGVYISEMSWPRVPGLEHCLFVTLRTTQNQPEGRRTLSRSQLWWLRIDENVTRIIAAGPLLNRDEPGGTVAESEDRTPVVTTQRDGSLCLAFASQVEGQPGWSVLLGPLSVSDDHRPVFQDRQARVVATRCRPGPLVFSADGRWLNALVADPKNHVTVARIPTSPGPTAPLTRADQATQAR